MNNLDTDYQCLLNDILSYGTKKEDRTGTGTLSVFGTIIRHDMRGGFPLLTTKKMAWKQIVSELQWFLKGSTDIRDLWANECYIWDDDWYKSYVKTCSSPYSLDEMKTFKKTNWAYFHKDTFSLGKIYGYQWRNWNGNIDQISELINQIQINPDSRRLLVNAWSPHEMDEMVLPPCHYAFQVYTRELSLEERFKLANYDWPPAGLPNQGIAHLEKRNIPKRAISLLWTQRSADVFLGLPFNIASYGLLLVMLANELNMIPEELVGNIGDAHLYLNHVEQAREQLTRTPYELPQVFVMDGIHSLMPGDVMLENYKSHPTLKAKLST